METTAKREWARIVRLLNAVNTLLLWTGLAVCAALSLLLLCGFRLAFLHGSSMQPTFDSGDTVLLARVDRQAAPAFGDLVTVWSESCGTYIMKRVIGLQGDTIELTESEVYRNGERLVEPYAIPCQYKEPKAFQIEDGHIFIMGDNRPTSLDSRSDKIGQVSVENVRGVYRWWVVVPDPCGSLLRGIRDGIAAAGNAVGLDVGL